MQKHTIYFELEGQLAKPDCPICSLREKAVSGYLNTLLYEEVNDIGVRAQIRRAKGFCKQHSWQLRAMGDPLAHAIIYRDLASEMLKALREPPAEHVKPGGWPFLRGAKGPRRVAESLKRRAECPVCKRAHETEARYLSSLLNYLGSDREMREAYGKSDGLCLPHLIEALEEASGIAAETLIAKERALLEALLKELEQLCQKFDYRFSSEPWAGEQDAWIRAVKHWVGLLNAEG